MAKFTRLDLGVTSRVTGLFIERKEFSCTGRVGGVLPGLSQRQCLVDAPPLSRTVLALFTHTALQMDFCFQLCGAVPLTSFTRFCVRSMFPCSARPSVDPFPPAALPAFIGTMGRSDSLPLVCPPSLCSVVEAYSCFQKKRQGLTSYLSVLISHMPRSPTPEESLLPRLCGCSLVDFRCVKNVVLLV